MPPDLPHSTPIHMKVVPCKPQHVLKAITFKCIFTLQRLPSLWPGTHLPSRRKIVQTFSLPGNKPGTSFEYFNLTQLHVCNHFHWKGNSSSSCFEWFNSLKHQEIYGTILSQQSQQLRSCSQFKPLHPGQYLTPHFEKMSWPWEMASSACPSWKTGGVAPYFNDLKRQFTMVPRMAKGLLQKSSTLSTCYLPRTHFLARSAKKCNLKRTCQHKPAANYLDKLFQAQNGCTSEQALDIQLDTAFSILSVPCFLTKYFSILNIPCNAPGTCMTGQYKRKDLGKGET